MKRYEMLAHIFNSKAVPTYRENKNGQFVFHRDVEALIKKAEYWEKQFRLEYRRVGSLCDQRDSIKKDLRRILENFL